MKFGFRKPNLKKRIKARTSGKVKRKIKSSVNPLYGKKGMGWIKDPKKAAYNKVYQQVTFDAIPSLKKAGSSRKNSATSFGCLLPIFLFISFLFPPLLLISLPLSIHRYQKNKKEKERALLQQKSFKELLKLEELILKSQEIKGLEPFFRRVESIFQIKKELSQSLQQLANKDYLEEESLNSAVAEIHEKIQHLLKDYISRYESDSFEEAKQLKTPNGQENNYQRSFEDLMAYHKFFDQEMKDYIEMTWREI